MKLDFSQVFNNLNKLDKKVHTNCERTMDYTMNQAGNYAKQNAPWKDRTGNARSSIFNHTHLENSLIIGTLGIDVYYGKYLELSNQGRYRIVRPTIDIHRNILMQNLREVM